MTYKENVMAILETCFAGFKEELIEAAADRINELDRTGGNVCVSRWKGNLFFGHYPNEFRFVCSNCNGKIDIMTRYCPHCGCRMVDVV